MVCFRGVTDEPEVVDLELPGSLEQLHQQFAVHKSTARVEPLFAANLCTVDDVYLSVLQNLILVGNSCLS